MLALTLQQLFGDSASQTATELVIKKVDLAEVGLTATASNRAEQLVVAVLLQVLRNFQGILTDENGNPITDIDNIPVEYDNRNFWEFLEIFKWGLYIPEGYTDRIRFAMIIHSYTHEN